MKSYLIYYLFITLSIIVNSCTEGFKEEYSKLVIALTEVTAITTPTTDTTPDYTFSSTGSGAITYGGSCSSSTTIATTGNNTITLNTLSVGTYADCTIKVSKTIVNENSEKKLSGSLTITSFTVSSTLSAPDNLSASGANNTIILTWNSVSGATSYTLYWDNVSGIDSSDTAITSITNDNYTDSNKETNYALDFDGSNDYVAADGVTSNLDSSTGLPFTVSAWAYPDTTNNGAIWAFNRTGFDTDENLNLLFYSPGNTKTFKHFGRTSYVGESDREFEPGRWYHIVVVVESGNGKMFVNGVEEAEWTSVINTSVNKFSIGHEYDDTGSDPSDYFDGKIDEVAVWNVALSAADVTALYNSGNGLKASADSGNYDNSGDLIGYWKFNDGTGSTLTDSTSNSNNGTLTNMDSSDWVNTGMDNGSIYYYKVAAVNSSGTGTLSSVASAILAQRIQASETFNGHTYALTSAATTWAQAKDIATALGGYLTTINTKAENDWLTTRFRIQHNATLWIGANDIAINNTWVWDNGTTSGDSGLTDNLSNNAKWADNITRKWVNGEPNHSGASCGHIWKTSGPNWDDTPCNNNKYAIIEFD